MPADPLRPATSNHAFLTHAARVAACDVLLGERAVERSEERLNILESCTTAVPLSVPCTA